MDAKRFAELQADIAANGVHVPLTLCEGKVLDGRNRYKACEALGLPFTTEEYDGNPWVYVWSLNGVRRDLSADQRAAIWVHCNAQSEAWQAEQARICDEANRKRGETAGSRGRKEDGTFQESSGGTLSATTGDKHKGREAKAAASGTNKGAVARAEQMERERPDLAAQVRAGNLKPEEARRQAKRDKAEQGSKDRPAVAEPVFVEVLPGEWWRLGEHLLFCGDSAGEEFRARATGAAFAFADPPYNADAAEWDADFDWRNDWLADSAEVVAVTPGIASIFDFARKSAMPYLWAMACWIDNGMTRGAMGFGNWVYVALFSHGSLHRNAQDFLRVSISPAKTADTKHKGRKPAGLVSYLVNTFTKKGDLVIDPFLGSGTTLLVCDRLGRKCIGAEIVPDFCAEIVRRWQAETGLEATRET